MDRIVRAPKVFLSHGFVEGISLVIRDGIIADIIASDLVNSAQAVRDTGIAAVVPPFCDRHLHFFHGDLSRLGEIAAALVACGVLEAYEGGSHDLSVGMEAKRLLKGKVNIRACGSALYKKGTYGRQIGHEISSPLEAELLFGRLAKLGADYVKIINSGIFRPARGDISPGGFAPAELKEIVGLAKREGLQVFCHANGDGAIRDAVLAGVSAIIHGFFVSDETLSLMAEKKVRFVPTINALNALTNRYPDPGIRKKIRDTVEAHLRATAKAAAAGVTVLPGSDAGPSFIPFGKSFLRELCFFEKAGLSLERIIEAAAQHPLDKGQRADFLLAEGFVPKAVFVAGEELGNGHPTV